MPVRYKANKIAEYLLFHSSTVIALSFIWYCIGLLFCEVLTGLHVCTWNWISCMHLELGYWKNEVCTALRFSAKDTKVV